MKSLSEYRQELKDLNSQEMVLRNRYEAVLGHWVYLIDVVGTRTYHELQPLHRELSELALEINNIIFQKHRVENRLAILSRA